MDATVAMYKKRLAKSQQTYQQGRENAANSPFGPKEPGMYKLQLQAINIDDITTKNGNVLVAKIEHLIIEGPNTDDVGETIYDSLFLEGDQSERDRTDEFITRFFNNLGFDAPDNKEDLPEAFAALVQASPVYMAKVTLSKPDEQYNRVRITKPVEDEGGSVDNGQTDGDGAGPAAEAAAEAGVDDTADQGEVVDDPRLGSLIEFGTAFGLDFSGKTVEEIAAELGNFPWDFAQLQPEEVTLLEEIGLGDKITNRPAPAPVKKVLPTRQAAAPAAAAPAKAPAAAAPVKKAPAKTILKKK